MTNAFTTTTFDFPGYRTVSTLGVVRGITVHSRSIVGSFVGGLQTNAIVGVRYDANEIMAGVTEVLCYGTAVVIEAQG